MPPAFCRGLDICLEMEPRAWQVSGLYLLASLLEGFARRTGVPVVVNTSLNTAGRPMVDDPRDALECFGSAPVDVLAIGPFLVRRPGRPAAARR